MESTEFPLLESDYPLSEEQIQDYHQDGFILIQNLATAAEIQAYRPLLQDVVERKVREKDAQGRKEGYGRFFHQVTNVWRLDARLQGLILARRFAHVAAQLMGVNGVRIYHDQALFKPAGGSMTPWHQDQFYWPLDTAQTITLWMPLVDVPREMGTMSFASGSHNDGSLVDLAISDESQRRLDRLVREQGYPVVSFALKAGDATFHSGWTVHNAHGNSSDQMREVITVIYYPAGTRLMVPDSEYRKVDLEVFHPGGQPGEPAEGPLHPLLYP
ncbi:MAG TPA: phytanoyl-CoA dioxygenase family protein [Bacteroidota bacterium]